MKMNMISTSFLAALAAMTQTTLGENANCVRQQNGATFKYIIKADNVEDIGATCDGLWDNLHRFADCVPSYTSCRPEGPGNPLLWTFEVGATCNKGMVGSAWWEQTRNVYGGISC